MTEAATATSQTETVVEGEEETSSAKEAIYVKIGEYVKEKTGKRIGKTGGREIFDTVVADIFAAAAKDGSFRFNGGFGSFHVKKYQAGERRLPSGQTTKFGEREKIRYEEGVVVKALIGNDGNLEEALKVRGSRAKPTVEEKPAKPAKEKPAKPAKEKPAAAAASPAADDVSLD